ncbi:hypothetical protein RI845_17660 [Thalassotalea nanhaiensis]|uniref:DUF4124 domain-containing protein n=1 Tax=Thalassotalea nanhaiensis TaxID=3065648 RepID=A0ABY9THM1_9GAMM|nr:hypothetical protein RI845_17660 [Colwelliaceae bacterium SQ345]
MSKQTMFNKIPSVLLLTLFSTTCFADIPKELVACADIDNKETRLQCYDNYMLKQSRTESEGTAVAVETPQPLVLSSEPESETLISTPVPPQVSSKKEQGSVQKEEQAIKKNFGLEHKKTSVEEATDSLIFTIATAKKSVHGKWTLTFTNEQKWVTISSERMKFKAEQEVIISRGMFNSFMLKVMNSNRSVKVKRIK